MNIACEFPRSTWSEEFLEAHNKATQLRKSMLCHLRLFSQHNHVHNHVPSAPPESTTKKTNPPRMIARSLSTSVLTSNVRLKTRGAKPAALQQSSANEMDVASVYPDGSFCCFIANDLPIAGSSFGALTGAVKDALRLKKHLVDRRQFKCVGELFNENATAQNVRQLFSSVKSLLKSKPRSRFVLFLACHTLHVPEEQEAWLGLFGFDPSNLEATSLEVRCLKTFAKLNRVLMSFIILRSKGIVFPLTRILT